MPSRHLLDPEMLPLSEFPSFSFGAVDIGQVRATMAANRPPQPPLPGDVQVHEARTPGRDGAPDVRLVVTSPKAAGPDRPGILHIHGGGYVLGSAEMTGPTDAAYASQLGAVVVSVDYRLAPETPYPGPVEDCYAGLAWLHAQAAALGVDPGRIVVTGESAGGGLAAALVLLAGDRGEYAVAFQHLVFPMLDDRTVTHPDPHPYVGQFVWTPDSNRFGWASLLGGPPGAPGRLAVRRARPRRRPRRPAADLHDLRRPRPLPRGGHGVRPPPDPRRRADRTAHLSRRAARLHVPAGRAAHADLRPGFHGRARARPGQKLNLSGCEFPTSGATLAGSQAVKAHPGLESPISGKVPDMKPIRYLLAALAGLMALAIGGAALAATAAELNANGAAALSKLYAAAPKAQSFSKKARAVLVFPRIIKAGFMVGAQTGDGVLFVNGQPAGYYNISAGSFGLQVGGQAFSYALFFMNQKALEYLKSSDGWSIGSGPSVVVLDKGKAMSNTSTTLTQDVYAFPFGQKGLMAGLGLEGSKITHINPK